MTDDTPPLTTEECKENNCTEVNNSECQQAISREEDQSPETTEESEQNILSPDKKNSIQNADAPSEPTDEIEKILKEKESAYSQQKLVRFFKKLGSLL